MLSRKFPGLVAATALGNSKLHLHRISCRYRSGPSEAAFDKVFTGSEYSKYDQERFITTTQGPLHILGIDTEQENVSVTQIRQQFKKKSAECDMKTHSGQKKQRDLAMAHRMLTDPGSAYYAPEKVYTDKKRWKLYNQLLPKHQQLKNRLMHWIIIGIGITLFYLVIKSMIRPALKLRQKRKNID